jgi:AcrR family transcriptional regulator
MSEVRRFSPRVRRLVILDAAVALANEKGILEVTFDNVADRCQVDTSKHTVRKYFGTVQALCSEIIADPNCKAEVKEHGQKLGY